MSEYLGVFQVEFRASDWKTATEIFERLLHDFDGVSFPKVNGKLLKELDCDFE